MQIVIEAIDLNIWEAIEIRPYVPTVVAGNTTIEKPRENWSEEERRRVQYNFKAKNIITSWINTLTHEYELFRMKTNESI